MSSFASSSRARSASPAAPKGFEWVEVSKEKVSIIRVSCPACKTGKDDLNVIALVQHWQSKHPTESEATLYDYLKTRHVRRAARPTYMAWLILRAETPKPVAAKRTITSLTKTKLNSLMVPCPFCPTTLTFSNLTNGTHTAGAACATSSNKDAAAIKALFSKLDREGRWSYLCLCYNIVKTGHQPGKKPVDLYQLTIETPRRSPLPPLAPPLGASRVPSPPRPQGATAMGPAGKGKGIAVGPSTGAETAGREGSPGRGRPRERERSCSRTRSPSVQGAQAAIGLSGTSTPPRASSKHSQRSSSSSSSGVSMISNPVADAASANTAWLQQQLGKRQRSPSSSGSSVAF